MEVRLSSRFALSLSVIAPSGRNANTDPECDTANRRERGIEILGIELIVIPISLLTDVQPGVASRGGGSVRAILDQQGGRSPTNSWTLGKR